MNRSLEKSIGADDLSQSRHRQSNCGTSLTSVNLRCNRKWFAGGDKTNGIGAARSRAFSTFSKRKECQSYEVPLSARVILARSFRPHSDGDCCMCFLKNRLKSCTRRYPRSDEIALTLVGGNMLSSH